jgi:hypothetical protein
MNVVGSATVYGFSTIRTYIIQSAAQQLFTKHARFYVQVDSTSPVALSFAFAQTLTTVSMVIQRATVVISPGLL